jgi:hypothetical protein
MMPALLIAALATLPPATFYNDAVQTQRLRPVSPNVPGFTPAAWARLGSAGDAAEAVTFRLFEFDDEGELPSVERLEPCLTINGRTVCPAFRYKGEGRQRVGVACVGVRANPDGAG